MNERIEKLANVWANLRAKDDRLGITYTFSEKALEKFAELIVRECMDCAEWVGKVNTTPVEPINTVHTIKKRIKEHFGVKE